MCADDVHRPVCFKCKNHLAVINARDLPYCSDCFVENFEYRTKVCFNSKHVPFNSRALLAISGGYSSRALLHIAHLFQDSKRKVQDQSRIRFSSMQVCTVDSTILDPEFEKVISHVRELAAKYDLDFTSVPIESVLTCEKTAKQLKTHLGTLSDDVVEEIESIYKENCLRRVALLHNCNCIVYGNNSTGGAIDALIQIARGKGTSLPRLFGPKDMQYCDKRELFFLRPLTGFTSKEVSMYVRIKGLSTITTKSQFLGQSKKTTRSTIRDFILNSDSGSQVSSTVVAAIASKIKPSAALPFSDICRLCGAPAENNAREWIAEKCKPVPSGRCTNVSECEDSLRSLSLSGSSLPPSGGIEGPPMCYSCIRLADDCSAPSSVSRRRDRVKASDPNFRPVDPSELRDNLLNVREVKGPDAAAAERKTIPQPSAGADL